MIEKLDAGLAGKLLIGLGCGLILFHTANLLGFVPQKITWLGKIESDRTMLVMGLVSIALNLVIVFCAAVKCNYWNSDIFSPIFSPVVEKILPFVFWWLVGNTIANFFSKSSLEVVVFTPILLVLTVCVYKIKTQTKVGTVFD